MTRQRKLRWILFASAIVALVGAGVAVFLHHRAQGDPGQSLFIIQRNTNANEVHYDVQTGSNGALAKDPVVAYWIMKAEGGRREDLTFMERKIAYGFEVSKPDGAGDVEVTLVAWEDRPIKLKKVGDKWRGLTKIDGKDAYLTKLFIQSKAGGVTPTVEYVDLFGEAVSGGKEVKEHVVKK